MQFTVSPHTLGAGLVSIVALTALVAFAGGLSSGSTSPTESTKSAPRRWDIPCEPTDTPGAKQSADEVLSRSATVAPTVASNVEPAPIPGVAVHTGPTPASCDPSKPHTAQQRRAGVPSTTVGERGEVIGSTPLSMVGPISSSPTNMELDEASEHVTRGPFVQLVKRREASVVWETREDMPTVLSYGTSGAMNRFWRDDVPKKRHVAKLEQLEPSTTYRFQALSETWATNVGQFTTEVGPTERHVVAVFGDTRTGHADHFAIVRRLIAHGPMLAFHSGDLVSDGAQVRMWDSFLSIEQPLMQRTVLYPAMGNHEGDGEQFKRVFELPENSPVPERFYSVRWAASLFVVLDQFGASLEPGGMQYLWLEQVLREAGDDSTIRNRFVVLHHGPYDSGKHGSNLVARTALVPLFERYHVDIVFSGHDHDYERSTVRGVKYIVSGGAGAPSHSVRGDWWTEVGETVTHYCILDILGGRVEVKAWRLDGTELDSFTLRPELQECIEPIDCSSRSSGQCEAEQSGQWACVHGACLWNCVRDTESEP